MKVISNAKEPIREERGTIWSTITSPKGRRLAELNKKLGE
jgi:hypothetical protein